MDPPEKKQRTEESSQSPTNEELLRQNEELREDLQHLQRKDEELRHEKKKNSVGAFFESMRPLTVNSESSAHTLTGYQEVDKKIVASPQQVALPEATWNNAISTAKINFQAGIQTEDDVTVQVNSLLRDVIRALELDDVLDVHINRSIMNVAPDLLVVLKTNKLPIGTVEVKKPGTEQEEKRIFGHGTSEVNGQVFDQMCLIQLNGPKAPIGVVTTWNKWQLLSLTKPFPSPSMKDAQRFKQHAPEVPAPGSKDIPSPDPPVTPKLGHDKRVALSSAPPRMPNGESEENPKHPKAGKVRAMSRNATRQLYASAPVEAGKNVGQLLATAVLLMLRSALDRQYILVKPLEAPARKISFSSDNPGSPFQRFTFCTHKLPNGILFDEVPDSKTNEFYILSPLGFGEHGFCCLATDKVGKACVIKFFFPTSLVENAKREAANWRSIIDADSRSEWQFCRVEKFGDRGDQQVCLLMPYLRGVPINERKALLDDGKESKLWTALKKFAEKGFKHDDLKWHHVGTFLSDGDREVALMDLGCVSPLEEASAETWADEAFEVLKKRVGEKNGNLHPLE